MAFLIKTIRIWFHPSLHRGILDQMSMGSQITALSQSELPMIKLIKADALKSCKMASLLAGKRSSCTEKNILKSNELKRY